MSQRPTITLLTRVGCHSCARAAEQLAVLCREFDLPLESVDVDLAAGDRPELRAEFGDRLPVVLLDGREHSYWEVDEPRLRADLARSVPGEQNHGGSERR
ncbi:glutaredoxin family protein [Rhodococcus sp. D2-41]|uniref:glutaredoxin family protein n=1 Tax=Speluncibacter jeojiensis TaxID=2710754 RepID=UPI00240F2B1B|nr:glutaredoxin family protein [Rhodococcus sp. D2-41]MDG3009932.1 glutaredoxin family protein [Rhodococcus sp. D2-41]